jgi:hypothetical protein
VLTRALGGCDSPSGHLLRLFLHGTALANVTADSSIHIQPLLVLLGQTLGEDATLVSQVLPPGLKLLLVHLLEDGFVFFAEFQQAGVHVVYIIYLAGKWSK